jgi:anti-sigma factor RsiW
MVDTRDGGFLVGEEPSVNKGCAMACRSLDGDLSAYLDRQLAPGAARRVERHLRHCDRCQAELAELRAMKALLAGAPQPQAPPGLWDAVHANLREHAGRQQRPRARPWLARAWGRAPVIATGLAVLLLAAVLPLQYLEQIPDRGGVTVDELVAQHAGYCARQPLLEHGRLYYLTAEAGADEAE